MTRVARPISIGTESGSRRTRLIVASQVRRRAVFGADGAGFGVHDALAGADRVFQGMVTSTGGICGVLLPWRSAEPTEDFYEGVGAGLGGGAQVGRVEVGGFGQRSQ